MTPHFPLSFFQEVVTLLLEFGADVSIVNAEGHRACDVTRRGHVTKMLEAAASHEVRLLNDRLHAAASEGNMTDITDIVSFMN